MMFVSFSNLDASDDVKGVDYLPLQVFCKRHKVMQGKKNVKYRNLMLYGPHKIGATAMRISSVQQVGSRGGAISISDL